ncbi:MAG: energy-coupling factor ABC transporter ATP-binding protein [Planctomycetota bacterium]|nr:energy-coupling factor ABC transporter ATP-binding protein [Planctomycetota bacterium]
MNGVLLEARGVSFAYPGGPKVIDNLSLSLSGRQSIGVVGANGAGKSTLLLLLAGALKPNSGEIVFAEAGRAPVNPATTPGRIGLAFQNPDDQLFLPSVSEDVAFGPRNQGLAATEVQERVTTALEETGIGHLARRPPFQLSGGEKRTAALASILSLQPAVLLLDEPTASLDPLARRRAMRLLASLEPLKIITSHDLDMIWDTCQQVVVLKQGRILTTGATQDIFTQPELLGEAGLEPPLRLQGCPRCGVAYSPPFAADLAGEGVAAVSV